jgi:hypothetical protein
MCQLYKRLDRGTFRVPEPDEADATSIAIDDRALDDLLDGIDVEAKPRAARRPRVH